jgi:epoxyqueuosine reductase
VNKKFTIAEISVAIRKKALELGFAGCGFSRAEALPEHALRLREWLDRGYHAGMQYMAGHFDKRTDPTLLVEEAKSVISLLYSYHTDKKQEDPQAPVISRYAFGKDYHFFLKEKMSRLLEFMRERFGEVRGRAFVDSAPVLDRAWAQRAGLGWIGRNSCLISRKAGSFVFIGELIVDLELEYKAVPEGDYCGSCNRCVEACPTQAILPERVLDARRCISYQTIENRSAVDAKFRESLEGRLFGCDICQEVCPWNRNLPNHAEPAFDPPVGLLEMTRSEWETMDQEQYRRLFKDSAIERAGFQKLKQTLSFL